MLKKIFLIINIPRLIPFIIFFILNKNNKEFEQDFRSFINYGVNKKKKYQILSFLNLLIYNKEYRNILYLRRNIFIKKLFSFFLPPLNSLYFLTPSAKIGKGVLIVHGFSTIINAEQIGENVTIFQQVTIGYGEGGTPTIGNNVKIYAGALIIGKVSIGDNCIIGAGTVITKNVKPHSTCVGMGFRIINNKI